MVLHEPPLFVQTWGIKRARVGGTVIPSGDFEKLYPPVMRLREDFPEHSATNASPTQDSGGRQGSRQAGRGTRCRIKTRFLCEETLLLPISFRKLNFRRLTFSVESLFVSSSPPSSFFFVRSPLVHETHVACREDYG